MSATVSRCDAGMRFPSEKLSSPKFGIDNLIDCDPQGRHMCAGDCGIQQKGTTEHRRVSPLRLPSQILKEREQAEGLRRQASAPGTRDGRPPPPQANSTPASAPASASVSPTVDFAHVQALEADRNRFKKLYGSLLIACEQSKAEARRCAELEAENVRLQAAEVENARLRAELRELGESVRLQAPPRMPSNGQTAQSRGNGSSAESLELSEQLKATQTVNATLNGEVNELQRRLRAVQRLRGDEMRPSACVVCLEHAANLVSLPCKHLALCSSCGDRPDVTCCPICRTEIQGRVHVFLP